MSSWKCMGTYTQHSDLNHLLYTVTLAPSLITDSRSSVLFAWHVKIPEYSTAAVNSSFADTMAAPPSPMLPNVAVCWEPAPNSAPSRNHDTTAGGALLPVTQVSVAVEPSVIARSVGCRKNSSISEMIMISKKKIQWCQRSIKAYQITTTWPIIWQFVQGNNKENTKAPHYCPFWEGIHQWLVAAPHNGPKKQKVH